VGCFHRLLFFAAGREHRQRFVLGHFSPWRQLSWRYALVRVAGSVTCGYRPGGWIDDGQQDIQSAAAPAWFVAAFPVLLLLWSRWFASGLVGLLAPVFSFLPTAVLNVRFCGDWSGQVAEKPRQFERVPHPARRGQQHSNAAAQFCSHGVPWADAWNRLMGRLIPPSLAKTLAHHFEPPARNFCWAKCRSRRWPAWGWGERAAAGDADYRLVRAPRGSVAGWIQRMIRTNRWSALRRGRGREFCWQRRA